VANIIAGGVGINLTAARQVFFNDLDWVPANHWQAEDRAYRIGQTGTVNVTYLVGSNTVDDFVQQLLATKELLVEAVVEGKSIDPNAMGDVLSELERMLGALSPGLADTTLADLSDDSNRALEDRPERIAHLRCVQLASNGKPIVEGVVSPAATKTGLSAPTKRQTGLGNRVESSLSS
jgi:hypothetical protein